jgi:Holliday junction resolvasome RuvABC endonuclease subunit
VLTISPKTVKKLYTGKGNASKKEVLEISIDKMRHTVTQDEADALAVAWAGSILSQEGDALYG